jgi:hypothetical protein
VIIHQHLDQTLTLMIAGHRVGHYSAEGKLLTPLTKKQVKAVEKTLGSGNGFLAYLLYLSAESRRPSLGAMDGAKPGSYIEVSGSDGDRPSE